MGHTCPEAHLSPWKQAGEGLEGNVGYLPNSVPSWKWLSRKDEEVPEQEIEPPSPGGRQNMWILNERILTFYVEMKSAELPYALHAASPNVSEHLIDLTIVQR